MFILDLPPLTPYTDPWIMPFEDRFAALVRGDRHVAYFYENPDNSTFRYRVYNMIQVLSEARPAISAAYFCQREIDRLDEVINAADVLVVCRSRYTDKLNDLIARAQSRNKRVFFDIDDLVFNPDYVHLVLRTLDQDCTHPKAWDHWFAYMGRLGATLRLCDRAIVTNDFLACQLKRYADKPVSVIPNFLNREQMLASLPVFQEKQRRQFARTDDIHLGYFSGTPTHNQDFDIVSDALLRVLDTDPRIRLLIVGFLDLKGPLRSHMSRIEFHPLQDFVALQRLIGSVEINLVPLQHNVFTNCKSELKYFEAGIVGTVTIASPVFTLVNAIRDGENGYLAKSFEWDDKLQHCLDRLDVYAEMAENAFVDSRQKYSWENQIKLVETTLFG